MKARTLASAIVGIAALLLFGACGGEDDVFYEHSHTIDTEYYGAAVASLSERVYSADVIVRATLVSREADQLNFRAVEYLKGTGPTSFSVEASAVGTNTQWDQNEAVLFLSTSVSDSSPSNSPGRSSDSSPATFAFADTTAWDYVGLGPESYQGDRPDGYTIDSNNPVWIPSTSRSSPPSGGNGLGKNAPDTPPSNPDFITESSDPDGTSSPTASLEDIKAIIAWLEGGDGVEGYSDCIRASLRDHRLFRDTTAYYGADVWDYKKIEQPIEAGAPAGTTINVFPHNGGPEYARRFLRGPDAHLFESVVVDADTDPTNGYSMSTQTLRPLPSGEYILTDQSQDDMFLPCDYLPESTYLIWDVKVSGSPADTTLEALFDPETIGSGDGYISAGDVSTGDLSPNDFHVVVGHVPTSITAITGDASSVTLSLDPYDALDRYTLEVITGDGTTSLTLTGAAATGDSAAGTLTWDVGSKPWSSGDELMLRLTVSPEDPAERTRTNSEYAELINSYCYDAVIVPIWGAVGDDTVIDCEALYDGVMPLRNGHQTKWSPTNGMEKWPGVTTEVVGDVLRVTGVDVTDIGMSGPFPASFAKVETLTSLKLSGNTFTGCIPRFLYYVDDHDLNSLGLEPCE